MARDPTRFWRSGPPLRGGSLRPRLLLALGAAASRRFPPAPRLGSLHSLAASARSASLATLALGAAASRRFPPAPRLGSLHSLAASARSVPLATLALGAAASRRVPPGPRLGSLHSLAPRLAPFRSRVWRSGPAPPWQPRSCSASARQAPGYYPICF